MYGSILILPYRVGSLCKNYCPIASSMPSPATGPATSASRCAQLSATASAQGEALPQETYMLSVSDTGVGFPAGLDFRQTTSLGLQLVCLLTEQLDGTIT